MTRVRRRWGAGHRARRVVKLSARACVVIAVLCCVGVAPSRATALNTNTTSNATTTTTTTTTAFAETYATAMDALRAFADAMATDAGRDGSVGEDERRTRMDAAARAVDALDAELGKTFRDALAREETETVMRMVRELVDGANDVEEGVEGGTEGEEKAEGETRSSSPRNGTAATTTKTGDDTVDTAAETATASSSGKGDDAESLLETYLLDTSAPETAAAKRTRVVDPTLDASDKTSATTVGVVLADVGKPYGESTLARAVGRFASRLGMPTVRPGKCSCDGSGGGSGKCSCDGACVVNENSVDAQSKTLDGAAFGAMTINTDRAPWMGRIAAKDSRWIAEVSHPVAFGFERVYRAAKHYISSEDAEFAPAPELLSCDAFTDALDPIREKCATMRCKTKFADMQKYITEHQKGMIFTQCPGFLRDAQTKRLRGASVATSETPSSAERRTRAKYATILPLGVDEDENLVALTYSFGFKISDLVFYRSAKVKADEEYDWTTEPEALKTKLESANRADLALYQKSLEQLDELKARPSFQARLDALRGMIKAASLFCEDQKVCSSGVEAKLSVDVDPKHSAILGEFPVSCGTEAASREMKCVDDWFLCEGPGATGSVWHSGVGGAEEEERGKTTGPTPSGKEEEDASSSTTTTTTTNEYSERRSDDDLDEAASIGQDSSTATAKVTAEAQSEPVVDRPKKSVAGATISAAVSVHRRSPWLWYSISFILLAVVVTSVAQHYIESSAAASPASSLDLGASILRERPVSAKEIGREMSANDDFWRGARTASPPRDRARGTGRSTGNAGRRPGRRGKSTQQRGPMTAEERAFYDEL